MNVTDLRILKMFLLRRNFKYKIGSLTAADGSCLLHALIQNMRFFAQLGLWTKEIPNVQELRKQIIQFMLSRRNHYVGCRDSHGNEVHGPLDEDSFNRLIADQSRESAYCDEEGFFVEAACLYLNIELEVVVTSIDTPVLQNGLGGPIQKINAGDGKLVFCAGLIRDDLRKTGHYQFIIKDTDNAQPGNNNLDLDSSRGKLNNNQLNISAFHVSQPLCFQFSLLPLQ